LQEDLEEIQGICRNKLHFLDALIESIEIGLDKKYENIKISEDMDDEMVTIFSDIAFLNEWKKETEMFYVLQRNMMLEKKDIDVYRLKLTLKNTKPSIWRIVEVYSFTKFDDLHDVIQELFDWTDSHPHIFEGIDNHGEKRVIRLPHNDPEMPEEEDHYDERYEFLFDYLTNRTRNLTYIYDFGDNWEVGIELKDIIPADPEKRYPSMLDGKRASPPEDCGGPLGYQDILRIIKDRTHPEYEKTLEWLGNGFDPDWFDAEEYLTEDEELWSDIKDL
jgi:hypothetical protein